jgi:small subunit ribosomal protein S9
MPTEKKAVPVKKTVPAKRVVTKVPAPAKAPAKPAVSHASGKYVEAVGRRKTAVARVRLYIAPHKGGFDVAVNEKPIQKYFPLEKHQKTVLAPFAATEENFPVTVQVRGGGVSAQAEAIRMGIARVLVSMKQEHRPRLKALEYLKRDSRMVERKKFGKRKARRPQQWRKR